MSKPKTFRPRQITPSHSAFRAILGWSFPPEPFYVAQIPRLLKEDILHRAKYSAFNLWIYRDERQNLIGFGTIDFCEDYKNLTGGKAHSYIPLLAVNPAFQGFGYGHRIVEHLVGLARKCASHEYNELADVVLLDVYVKNIPAISLYKKHGFVALNDDEPISDPLENNEPYVVMARKLSCAERETTG